MDEETGTRDSNLATPHHTIRLRHPWQCELSGETVIWSRKFNWPAELANDEAVQLVIEHATTADIFTLNDSTLDFDPAQPIDITSLLRGHNRLTISSDVVDDRTYEKFPYEVRLEIVAAC